MSTIELADVSKHWGTMRAVDRVSFSVQAGSFAVLLGPSGCGKSTTLRLVAGLEQLSEGRILIDGRNVSAEPPAARRIAMVFQSYALFPHLSVAENILFGLKVRKVDPAEQSRRLARVADLLGLTALLSRKPSQLSGGQQQRVALGRAIIAEAPVCLMDEPLSNLDARLRNEMRRELRALQQSLGITMLYVTHDQVEAMSMADQVILMRSGRIEQNASPADLYERPATAFAASFIGTPPMNLLPLEPGPDGCRIEGTESPRLTSESIAGLLVGVRPEDVRVADHGPFTARVQSVEYLGADSVITCSYGKATIVVRQPGRLVPVIGETLRLAWSPSAQHWFDGATGQRRDDVATVA
jgi:sn-glycerol 3-phosphate transport system ATP-binding protein